MHAAQAGSTLLGTSATGVLDGFNDASISHSLTFVCFLCRRATLGGDRQRRIRKRR
jgi:hypothetical protein